MKFSIICVYNNEQLLEEQLLSSINKNKIDCELILVDNKNSQFSSASSALNYGVNQSTGEVLIFSHQDIYIKFPGEIERLANDIYNLPLGSIVGAQGAIEGNKEDISNLTAGSELNLKKGQMISDLTECACVDEGLFGMRRETYQSLLFNETLCDNWHLYAVEMCLHTRIKGGKVYIHPIQIHHFSYGHISVGYMKNMVRLVDYYHKDLRYIWTTCYKVRANKITIRLLYCVWVISRIVRRKSLK